MNLNQKIYEYLSYALVIVLGIAGAGATTGSSVQMDEKYYMDKKCAWDGNDWYCTNSNENYCHLYDSNNDGAWEDCGTGQC